MTFFRRGIIAGLSAHHFVVFFLMAGLLTGLKTVAQTQPNIIFILADDLGYASLGCYGQLSRDTAALPALRTPYLDTLAARGIRFTDHYSGAPTCAPARATLLTGLHTGHVNIRANRGFSPGNEPLDSVPTLAGALQDAGYRTVAIGKWGLGGEVSQNYEAHPLRRGFGEYFGVLDQTQCHQQYLDRVTSLNPGAEIWQDYSRILPGMDVPETYANNLFGQQALRVIADAYDEGPFFIYLALTTPHARMESPPSGLSLREDTADWPDHEKAYSAMVSSMDFQVGRIMRALDSLGIADQTIIMFSSDNGPHDEAGSLGTTPPHDWEFFDENAPYRGRKRQLLEGGIRVPLIACWPGVIAPGTVSDLPCGNWDLFPTLAELGGAAIPPEIDGLSVAPTLTGLGRQQHHFALYWEFEDLFLRQAIRMGPWKALRNGHTAPVQLYNLPDDPGEALNLALSQPGLAQQMADYMLCLREPSPDFPSPIDGWPVPDCPFFTLSLTQPEEDSRVVQPELQELTLMVSAASQDDAPLTVQIFYQSGVPVELALEPSADGLWRADWTPPGYGMHTFQLIARHPDGREFERQVSFEVASCPLVQLSPALWTVSATDSEESEAAPNQAFRAIDGDPSTFWHTQWFDADPPHPHFIEVDLKNTYLIGGLDYVPRPGPSENGIIADYALFLRQTDSTRQARVTAGHWPWQDVPAVQSLRFPVRQARYFRLEAYSEINGGPWTTAAELRIFVDSCWAKPDTATEPPPLGLGSGFGKESTAIFPNPVERGQWITVQYTFSSGSASGSLQDFLWTGAGGQSVPAFAIHAASGVNVRAPSQPGWWWLGLPEGGGVRVLVL